MTNVYSGTKEVSYIISDTKRVTDMVSGVRVVLVNGVPLPSALIQEENQNDNYRCYDWGFMGNRELGMNLSASILDHQYPNINIEYELVYMFFKTVVSKFDDVWLITGDEIEGFVPELYKELFGEKI